MMDKFPYQRGFPDTAQTGEQNHIPCIQTGADTFQQARSRHNTLEGESAIPPRTHAA